MKHTNTRVAWGGGGPWHAQQPWHSKHDVNSRGGRKGRPILSDTHMCAKSHMRHRSTAWAGLLLSGAHERAAVTWVCGRHARPCVDSKVMGMHAAVLGACRGPGRRHSRGCARFVRARARPAGGWAQKRGRAKAGSGVSIGLA